MTEWLTRWLNPLYRKLFGHEMGGRMLSFLQHVSYTLLGGLAAGGILFVLKVYAGRLLGPEEFGKYGLVLSLSNLGVFLMILGLDTASVYYVARTPTPKEKKAYIGSSLWLVTFLSTTVGAAAYIGGDWIAAYLNLDRSLFDLTIIFSACMSFKLLLFGYIQGLHLFALQAWAMVLEAIGSTIFFLVIVHVFLYQQASTIIWADITGYLCLILLVVLILYKRFSITTIHTKEMVIYGLSSLPLAMSGIALDSVDKIFINQYLTRELLGVYTAYSLVSLAIVGHFTGMVVNVLFPYASSMEEKKRLFHKLNRVFAIFSLPATLGLAGTTAVLILLFGEEYPLVISLIFTFAVLGILKTYFQLLWWLIASMGPQAIRFVSRQGFLTGVIYIGLLFTFRHQLSLFLVVAFQILAITYGAIIGNLNYHRFLSDKE